MRRVTLIHWHAAEAAERAERLRRLGYAAEPATPRGLAELRALGESRPAAFVIDLGRLPSQGRDLAIWLRRAPATRRVPIVFAGGDPQKVAKVRELLPDAAYAEWDGIRDALRRALSSPPAEPVVPGVFAGYSGTPLPKKLGIKAGSVVALLGAPADFRETLGELPPEVRLKRQARGSADVILLFARSRAELARRFPAADRALAEKGSLWLAWPKQASGVATDLDQAAVRRFGLDRSYVDYKIAAIDATWSGLRFARRR